MFHFFAIMLWIASGLAFVGQMPQLGVAIIAVIVFNGLFSFAQEYRAERAIRTLSALLPETAVVRRDGHKTRVPSAELVPGDLVLLAEGDRISADARVIRSVGLKVDNSMLTGESEPVSRGDETLDRAPADIADAANLVFAGTFVASGSATVAVAATGPRTRLGAISELTPFVVWALSAGRIPLMITVLQVLALDIGTDILPALALGAERPEPGVMERPPRPCRARLLDRRVLGRAFGFLGPVEAGLSMAMLPLGAAVFFGWPTQALPRAATDKLVLSTMVFASIALMQMAVALQCRGTPASLTSIRPLSNRLLNAALLVELLALSAFVYAPPVYRVLGQRPLTPAQWIPILVAPWLLLVAEELRKLIVRRHGSARWDLDLERDQAEQLPAHLPTAVVVAGSRRPRGGVKLLSLCRGGSCPAGRRGVPAGPPPPWRSAARSCRRCGRCAGGRPQRRWRRQGLPSGARRPAPG